MRRLFTIALSLLALGGAARAADLPPAPQLPPMEAEPLWTGFYAGLNVGGAFGSSRNAFTVAGFGLPSFATSLDGVIGGRGRLQLADGPLGPWPRGEFRGERAQRRAQCAVRAAALRSVGGKLRAEALLVWDAAAEDRLCARELALLRHRRRRPRPSRDECGRGGRALRGRRQAWRDARRLDAGRRRRSRVGAGLEREDRISLSRSGQPHDHLSYEPADLERLAPERQCDHHRRELPLLIQSARSWRRRTKAIEAALRDRKRPEWSR